MKESPDWLSAYFEIGEAIKQESTGIPDIKHIDLWHEQVDYVAEEYPWASGSLFVEFAAVDIESTGEKVQDLLMDISFIYVLDTLSETYIESPTADIVKQFGSTLQKLHAFLQGKTGVNYSALNRVGLARVSAPQYLLAYKQVYRCIVRDQSAITDTVEALVQSVTVKKNISTAPSGSDSLFVVPL